jgi:hypothetical protein
VTMGKLVLDGWAGRERIPVEIVGETPKRYRVRLLAAALVLVPRYAVRLDELAADQDQAQA